VHDVSYLLGPFAIVAVVLVVGGVFKLRDPAPSHEMLRSLSLPPSDLLARLVGAGEVVLGVGALLVGGPVLGAATALVFTAFAVVNHRLLRSGGAVSCGCFGKRSSPPSMVHVVANAGAAIVSVAAASTATEGLWFARHADVLELVLLLAVVAAGSFLLVTIMTVLPDTLDAARRGPRPPAVPTFGITQPPANASPARSDNGRLP
jgi:hypothetical protein